MRVYRLIQKRIAPLAFAITIMLIFLCSFTSSLWAVGQTYTLTISFSESPSTYLPMANDLITVNATTSPTQSGVEVTFTLTQRDQFSFSDGTTSPKTATTNGSGVASVTIKSLSYYGVAKIAVTATNYTGDEEQIPIDSDDDLIADSWEQTYGGTAPNYLNPNDDNESVSGISETGDGFTVLNEYKGYTIPGLGHSRMDPTEKEVFFLNGSNATGADFAKSGLLGLGLTVIAPTSGNPITFLGSQSRKRINCHKSTYYSSLTDGDVFNSNGTTKGDTTIYFGITSTLYKSSGEMCNVYETAISNLYSLNGVYESIVEPFSWPGWAENGSQATYYAIFDGDDLNGDGDDLDQINVFDLMSPSEDPNDAIDDKIGTMTQAETLNRTARHEVGHIVGMDHASTSVSSVMRQGNGPAKVDSFTSTDKNQVDLK